ncbi:hypothetical protein vBBceSLY1_00009 [Bacillus phage vB_BceS_LY1]|uniref:Uncharacterized protein n=1 Tax=Bacillus phage vB_BceS_LY1 TaxID=2950459 RepID=A0AAE9LV14_9CAUD|nr:hypothetical protein vBBceSLY1_00009 [Bacillus phage vB_BceS_LY1]
MKIKKVAFVREIVKVIEEKGFTGREAQRVLIEAAQYGADVSNEKANNMAIALFLNVNDESQKVANRFKKEELVQILSYLTDETPSNADLDSEKEEMVAIAASNKEIIEKHQYISEVNRIMNLRRNRNSQLLVDTLTHTLLDLGFRASEVSDMSITICRKYWREAANKMNHTQAKLLYTAIKQKTL